MTNEVLCAGCGQLKGNESYDDSLWDIYHRIDDGRADREALVFFASDEDCDYYEDEGIDTRTLAMERDMHSRGLCVKCGRPNLQGVKPESILSEEEAQSRADMHAEMRAEQRIGA